MNCINTICRLRNFLPPTFASLQMPMQASCEGQRLPAEAMNLQAVRLKGTFESLHAIEANLCPTSYLNVSTTADTASKMS